MHDLWTPESNTRYVDFKKVAEYDNPTGKVPFVISPVSTTPWVNGDDEVANVSMVGPSIFTGAENDYEIINKVDSILLTLLYCGFRPPIAVKTESGDKAPDQYPYEHGTFIKMFHEDKLEKVPLGDVMWEASYLYQARDAAFQRMTLPYNEFGGLNFELSALAIEKLEKQRAQLFNPRLIAMERLYEDSYQMLFNQWLDMGLGVFTSNEQDADEFEFEPSHYQDYKGKFLLYCKMTTESPEGDIAKLGKAASALQIGFSQETVLADIMKVEDPQKELMRRNNEEVEMLVPALKLKRAVDSLVERASKATSPEERDSYLLEAEIVEAEQMRLYQGQQAQPVGMGAGPPQSSIPMLPASQPQPTAQVVTPKREKAGSEREVEVER